MKNEHFDNQIIINKKTVDQPSLLEIKLNGSYSLARLLELLNEEIGIDFIIKRGFVNYHEGANYGKVLFLVRDSRTRVVLLATLLNEFYRIPAQLLEGKITGSGEKKNR